MSRRGAHIPTVRLAIVLSLVVAGCLDRERDPPLAPAEPAAVEPSPAASLSLRFVDVTVNSGLTHSVVFGSIDKKTLLIETTGAGLAVADFNLDGIEDLYFANGSTIERFRRGDNPTGWLYRGNGDGTFSDVTAGSGADLPMWGCGAFAADYDNDGDQDLYLTAFGPNALLRNRGDGTFEDVTAEAGVGDPSYSLGAAFTDIDRDGHPDIYVANYVVLDVDHPPNGGKLCDLRGSGLLALCGPGGLEAAADRYYHNRGDGTFVDWTAERGLVPPKNLYGMSVVAFDPDGDGRLDYYVTNDSVPNLLFRQLATDQFVDISIASGSALNANGFPQASMGVAVGDANADGLDDIYVTNFDLDTNTFYKNVGGARFEDTTQETGLGAPTFNSLGWATGLYDFDNDGDLDVYVVNGHVFPEVDTSQILGDYLQPIQMFENEGPGTFVEAPPAADGRRFGGRGAATLDLDGDGRLDFIATNISGPPIALRNESPQRGGWLYVELEGTHCARDAYGARLVVRGAGRALHRSHLYTQGYLSTPSSRLHIGVGSATEVDIEVRWPCGTTQTFAGVHANSRVRLREGEVLARLHPGRQGADQSNETRGSTTVR